MYKKFVLAPVLVVLVAMVALASVFVYYPLTINVQPQAPSVVFKEGSNANQFDIRGNTITVEIGANGTSASVTIHPTYQENYYKNVTIIKNVDDNAMNVYIIFTSVTNNLPSDSNITMIIYQDYSIIKSLDIINSDWNKPINVGSMNSGAVWEIDFYVYIPEGKSISGASYRVNAKLVYTPSSETPPSNPGSGR
ncbi:MAG: hypothetical protein QXD69_05535 [Candidatus Bathyarchaeia archaeon]